MSGSVGVYVHIPFCARVCPYCDFAVTAAPECVDSANPPKGEARYVEALLAELALRAGAFEGRRLETLYFGGGTPSLFTARSIQRIREAAFGAFAPGSDPEVTLEVNPSTVERGRLAAFREAGVGRLSLGIQSFDDDQLRALGRAHWAEEARLTFRAARDAGFDNVSIDLMFAALGQTHAMLEADLAEVCALGPEHVSTYELVFEPGTPFGRAAEKGSLEPFSEDLAADMVATIEDRLGAAGYTAYELTNFARPGYASRHNQRYWQREPVLGIGVGAHSFDPAAEGRPFGARLSNPRSLEAWLTRIEASEPGIETEEVLDADQALGEFCFLSLRCASGLDPVAFEDLFGGPPRQFFEAEIEDLIARGLLAEDPGGALRLTARGRLLADEALATFV